MIAVLRRPFRSLFATTRAALVLLGVAAIANAVINPAEWQYRQEFVVEALGLTKLSLPTETIDLARAGFADLRIIDPSGQEIPYTTETPSPPVPLRLQPRRFQVELQKLATQVTLETGSAGLLEGVELETPTRDFVKAVRLEISLDGKQWELVADGVQLARGRQLDQRTVHFNKTVASFVRLTLDDWRTPVVPFTGATLLVAAAASDPTLPVDAAISKREEFANETVLTLELPARHLPLAAIDFSVGDRIFSRSVDVTERRLVDGESAEQMLASGFISRYQSPQQALREQLRVPLNLSSASRQLEVHIQNENNAPLAIERAFVWRRPVWLTFNANASGTYVILTGHAEVTPPRYDLEGFSADLRTLPETRAAIGRALPNPDFRPVDRLADTPLLGSALDTSNWKFRKNVTPAAAGVQELELDLDVLAHAQPAFGDLRLMRDGHQVPYLLERTSLLRPLTIVPAVADNPREPRISRWRLTLPRERLPIQRLTLRSETTLFSRTVAIFEVIQDSRGETFRRPLSNSIPWNVTPDHHERRRVITLLAAPQTNQLEIEIDNGDNPPISLANIQADYPVTRLLFRADSNPVQLYYGSDTANAPRYDLQLVAHQLINREKHLATAGDEESLGGGAKALLVGVRGGLALWIALGLVVAVLLVVIARLLPKPAGQQPK